MWGLGAASGSRVLFLRAARGGGGVVVVSFGLRVGFREGLRGSVGLWGRCGLGFREGV